jgi:hypothetical protein
MCVECVNRLFGKYEMEEWFKTDNKCWKVRVKNGELEMFALF